MKPLEEQTHYEALEVPMDATAEEIERAYRVASASYASDSVALYSIFDEASAESIRERIELAYRVLSDGERRSAYDTRAGAPPPLPAAPPLMAESAAPSAPPVESSTPMAELEDLEDEEEGHDWSGPKLRRARLRRGFELDQIAEKTKINSTYLRCIEEEIYGDLPAPVYVRGFITAYARVVGLDAPRVAGSYLERLERSTPDKRPNRLLGRR